MKFAGDNGSNRNLFMKHLLSGLLLLMVLLGCAEKFDHDPDLASRRAVEFAEVAFVQHDFDRSDLLLADKARSYIPLEKYKESILSYHPGGYPAKITVVSAHPVPGEKLISVSLSGEGGGGPLGYTLRLAGTAATDYRVTSSTRNF